MLNKALIEWHRRADFLRDKIGDLSEVLDIADQEEVEEILRQLDEYQDELRIIEAITAPI